MAPFYHLAVIDFDYTLEDFGWRAVETLTANMTFTFTTADAAARAAALAIASAGIREAETAVRADPVLKAAWVCASYHTVLGYSCCQPDAYVGVVLGRAGRRPFAFVGRGDDVRRQLSAHRRYSPDWVAAVGPDLFEVAELEALLSG